MCCISQKSEIIRHKSLRGFTLVELLAVITITGVLAVLSQSVSAVETVTVKANILASGVGGVYGSVDTRYSGFIYGIDATSNPGSNLFEKLKPSVVRASALNGDFANYPRIVAAGGTFQYLLSDANLGTPLPGGSGDPTYSLWDATVNAKIAAAKAAGATTGQWDLWNEPNFSTFWSDQTPAGRDKFFETWRRTYTRVRAELPNIKIAGPSLAPMYSNNPADGTINYDNFLNYAKANNVMPDVVTIHAFQKEQGGIYATWLRNKFTSLNLTKTPTIDSNEMICNFEQFRPGVIPHYFANLRAANVDYGVHACWNDPVWDGASPPNVNNGFNNSLDGLLTPDTKQPRSVWWVYEKYAEMSGNYVSLTGSSSVTGLASVDAANKELMVLLGRDVGYDPTGFGPLSVTLQVDQLRTALGFSGMLQADLWRIPNSGSDALASPTLAGSSLLAADSLSLTLPNFGANDAYYVTLRAVPEPGALVLLGCALSGLLTYAWRKREVIWDLKRRVCR